MKIGQDLLDIQHLYLYILIYDPGPGEEHRAPDPARDGLLEEDSADRQRYEGQETLRIMCFFQ